jgi:hypothetical protein
VADYAYFPSELARSRLLKFSELGGSALNFKTRSMSSSRVTLRSHAQMFISWLISLVYFCDHHQSLSPVINPQSLFQIAPLLNRPFAQLNYCILYLSRVSRTLALDNASGAIASSQVKDGGLPKHIETTRTMSCSTHRTSRVRLSINRTPITTDDYIFADTNSVQQCDGTLTSLSFISDL